MTLVLESPAFAAGETIPVKYTGEGDDVSPPLAWRGVPEDARCLLVACDDPDAPSGTFHHWLAWNIPPDWNALPEGFGPETDKAGVRQALNDFGRPGYGGPLPPPGDGAHAYHFRVSALSAPIEAAAPDAGWAEIDRLARPLVIEEAELVGFYARRRG